MDITDISIKDSMRSLAVANSPSLLYSKSNRNSTDSDLCISKKSVAETFCRQAMNHLLGSTFNSTRDVLTKEVLDRPHDLELDGYCDKLKIAFEYQGFPSHWDKNHPKYEATSAKDLIKKQACKKLGITLVVIPPFDVRSLRSSEFVLGFVSACLKLAFQESDRQLPRLSTSEFVLNSEIESCDQSFIEFMSDIAREHGGELLDRQWKGYKATYRFKDANGIEFNRSYKTLKIHGWLNTSAMSSKSRETYLKHLEQMRKLAELSGCTLITTIDSIGKDRKLEFESALGVRFFISLKYVKENGLPAKYCAPGSPGFNEAQARLNARPIGLKNMEAMRKLAQSHNAELLCTDWVSNHTKYSFKLETGQVVWISCVRLMQYGWPKDPSIPIKSRYVNPKIADIRREARKEKRLSNLKNIAAKKGFTLLSSSFESTDSTYLFRNSSGEEVALPYRHFIGKRLPNISSSESNQGVDGNRIENRGSSYLNFAANIAKESGVDFRVLQ